MGAVTDKIYKYKLKFVEHIKLQKINQRNDKDIQLWNSFDTTISCNSKNRIIPTPRPLAPCYTRQDSVNGVCKI